MAYVRRGMGIRDLLTYAEEALESTPAKKPTASAVIEGMTAPVTPLGQRWTSCRFSPVVKERSPFG